MAEAPPPYWVLISVLFSSLPLEPQLAMALYHVAYELHGSGAGEGEVSAKLAHGKVTNLRKDALLGTIGGPVFEASLETERGQAQVRFLLTRNGLQMREEQEQGPAAGWGRAPQMLN